MLGVACLGSQPVQPSSETVQEQKSGCRCSSRPPLRVESDFVRAACRCGGVDPCCSADQKAPLNGAFVGASAVACSNMQMMPEVKDWDLWG